MFAGVTVESMVSSFCSMTESMYIAQECLKSNTPEVEDESVAPVSPFEGLQALADAIATGFMNILTF